MKNYFVPEKIDALPEELAAKFKDFLKACNAPGNLAQKRGTASARLSVFKTAYIKKYKTNYMEEELAFTIHELMSQFF